MRKKSKGFAAMSCAVSKDAKVDKLPKTLKDDAIGFFEAIKLAGLEGKWMRISFAVQRRFFERTPFGKKSVKVDERGEIRTFQTMDFGNDFDEQIYRYNHAAGHFAYAFNFEKAPI